MAKVTRAMLQNSINTLLADNSTEEISPEDVRTVTSDTIDSMRMDEDFPANPIDPTLMIIGIYTSVEALPSLTLPNLYAVVSVGGADSIHKTDKSGSWSLYFNLSGDTRYIGIFESKDDFPAGVSSQYALVDGYKVLAYINIGGDWVSIADSDFIDLYRSLRSFSGISLPAGTAPAFNVVSSGSAGPPYNIMHLNLATQGGQIRGAGFTANTDGTVTVNKDMFAAAVSINAVATFPTTDNVVIGIGIGDPASIPTTPGSQVGENYVSRFRCSRNGEGNTDEVSWDLYSSPVGKSTTSIEVNGLKIGDKIFPVIWTQEADNSVLTVGDLIFTVEEISI